MALTQLSIRRGNLAVPVNATDSGSLFKNNGPDTVYYGGSRDVTSATGTSIASGASASLTGSQYLVVANGAALAKVSVTSPDVGIDGDTQIANVKGYGARGDGVTDDTAAILDAYAYFAAVVSTQAEQYGSPLLRSLYFPAGDYYAPGVGTLATTSNFQTFTGDGFNTRVRGIAFQIKHNKCGVHNMKLTDSGTYGVVLNDESQVFNGGSGNSARRFFSMSGVYIRDKTYGWAQLDSGSLGQVERCIFEKNDEGLYQFADNTLNTDRGDIWFTNCQFISNNNYGIHIRKGGISMSDCKVSNSGIYGLYMRPTAASANEVVRACYVSNCSFESTQESRTVAITGITNNGDGTVTITTAAPHNYTAAMSVKVSGTTNYNATYTVLTVPSTTTLTVTATYVSSQTGSLYSANYDVYIDAEGSNGYYVNDCMFVGGDINYLGVNAGYNIAFQATQIKYQRFVGENSNKIVFYNTTRGRSGLSGFIDTPVSGAANGWSEFSYYDTDNIPGNTGGYATVRTPHNAGGLVGNVPAYLNEVRVAEDGVAIIAKGGAQFTGAVRETVVALTDAATIATDAALGNVFKVTLAASRVMGNPTNPVAGQKILYRLIQDSTGSWTVTWDTAFRFSTDTPAPVLTTTAAKIDYVAFLYNSTDSKWDCLGYSRGY